MQSENIPNHIGIIMDGNRRWAKERGLPAFEGHREGEKTLRKIADACLKFGVKILTVFAFSSENWKRSEEEVSFLLGLMEKLFSNYLEDFKKKGIRINVIGQIEKFPEKLQKIIRETMDGTKDCANGIFNIALSYGGRQEIIEAVKKIVAEKIAPENINEEMFENYLYTAGQPDPDFIIRTSGEQRLSGFLTWQGVYSELYFTPKYWPEFSEKDLEFAIEEYQSRKRRFGK